MRMAKDTWTHRVGLLCVHDLLVEGKGSTQFHLQLTFIANAHPKIHFFLSSHQASRIAYCTLQKQQDNTLAFNSLKTLQDASSVVATFALDRTAHGGHWTSFFWADSCAHTALSTVTLHPSSAAMELPTKRVPVRMDVGPSSFCKPFCGSVCKLPRFKLFHLRPFLVASVTYVSFPHV